MIFWFIKYKLNNRKSRNKNLEMVSGLRGSNPGRFRVANRVDLGLSGHEEQPSPSQNPATATGSGEAKNEPPDHRFSSFLTPFDSLEFQPSPHSVTTIRESPLRHLRPQVEVLRWTSSENRVPPNVNQIWRNWCQSTPKSTI